MMPHQIVGEDAINLPNTTFCRSGLSSDRRRRRDRGHKTASTETAVHLAFVTRRQITMTPPEVIRALRQIRYTHRSQRPQAIAWIARQAGFQRQSLYRIIRRGTLSQQTARRLAAVLTNVTPKGGHNTLSSYGGGTARIRDWRTPGNRRPRARNTSGTDIS
jgi:hypothetical protein